MSGYGTLIVGASQAGLQLAVSLRQFGDTAPITLVGEEPHPPYQRPPLSKEFLAGEADLDSLAFRAPGFYADSGIDLVCGERVTALDPLRRRPGRLRRRGHRERARTALRPAGADHRRRTPAADAARRGTRRHLLPARPRRRRRPAGPAGDRARVVVVGGGFIGLEAAAAARARGAARSPSSRRRTG